MYIWDMYTDLYILPSARQKALIEGEQSLREHIRIREHILMN